MINQEILQRLKDIILPHLKNNNLELVEINYSARNRPLLTLFIDRPEGGVTMEECALMNNIISEALNSANIFNSGYVLEVCSPGIDRPLKEEKDFLRVINRKIICILKEPINAKKEIRGQVKEVDTQTLTLDTDMGKIKIFYRNLIKARQIID